jgi:hypothetical protein
MWQSLWLPGFAEIYIRRALRIDLGRRGRTTGWVCALGEGRWVRRPVAPGASRAWAVSHCGGAVAAGFADGRTAIPEECGMGQKWAGGSPATATGRDHCCSHNVDVGCNHGS